MSTRECSSTADCASVDCGGSLATDVATCIDGACKCQERAFFFVLFGAYMFSLVVVAYYGYTMTPPHITDGDGGGSGSGSGGGGGGGEGDESRRRSVAAATKEDGNDDGDGDGDGDGDVGGAPSVAPRVARPPPSAHIVLMDRFMPRAGFGVVVMSATLFSTLYSGYSVIGIPGDTQRAGFFALRWLATTLPGVSAMLLFYPRFRRVGLARNYASPSDVFADRFNCQSLRLVATLVMLFVQLIYTAAQFKAIYDIVDVIALGRVDAYETTAFVMVVTVVCDWIGGQRGITLSDVIQASLIVASLLTLPFVLLARYRSFSQLMTDCHGDNCIRRRRPWFETTPTVAGTCLLKNNATDPNCYRSHFASQAEYDAGLQVWGLDPDTLTIFDHQALSMLGFIANGFAFPMQTHFLQKLFLARSEAVLRQAIFALTVSSFVVFLPSFYYGILAAADFSLEDDPAVPMLCGRLMDFGGVSQAVAVFSLIAVIAAMMSTADSTIIGATNIWICTWVKGFLLPNKTGQTYTRITFVVTPLFAWAAMTFAVHADEIRFDTLISIQNSINWQAVPAFTVAMFSDRVAAYPLLLGMIVGLVITLTIETLQALDHNDNEHHFHRHRFDPLLPSGIYGVAANVAVVAASQWAVDRMGMRALSDDSQRSFDTVAESVRATYGPSRLTAAEVERIVAGPPEPLADATRRRVTVASAVVMFFSLPWYRPAFTSDPVSAGGFPEWASGLLAGTVICYVMQLWCIWSWEPTDKPIEGLHYGWEGMGEERYHYDVDIAPVIAADADDGGVGAGGKAPLGEGVPWDGLAAPASLGSGGACSPVANGDADSDDDADVATGDIAAGGASEA